MPDSLNFHYESCKYATNSSCTLLLSFILYSIFSVQPTLEVSDFVNEGTPVPIPNTVVKLIYVDNTWLEAAREDRSSLTLMTSKL